MERPHRSAGERQRMERAKTTKEPEREVQVEDDQARAEKWGVMPKVTKDGRDREDTKSVNVVVV